MLKLIVCYDLKKGIGKQGKIPWNIHSEMQHFKQTTLNHTVVMGRKTYESIGHILANRNNIVFSNNKDLKIANALVTNDLDYIVDLSKKEDVYIIGGKQIYKLFEPYYDELLISELNNDYDCDTFLNLNFKNFYEYKHIENEEYTLRIFKSYKHKILYASKCQSYWKNLLIQEKNKLVKQYNIIPCLAIVQVGNDYASNIYIKNKCKLANELGIEVKLVNLDENITQKALLNIIDELNNDDLVHGILVQLPIPNHLNKQDLFLHINPDKDVDAFHVMNVGKLWTNYNLEQTLVSCTPRGIIKLLEFYQIEIARKNVVIIGRSEIVSKPLISLFLNKDATVQVCHSKTTDLKQKTLNADILICAIGKANFITKDYIKKDAIVIDVGINHLDNQLTGDVDFCDVIEKVKYISPVPGGVGLMTLVMLFYNLLICYKKTILTH